MLPASPTILHGLPLQVPERVGPAEPAFLEGGRRDLPTVRSSESVPFCADLVPEERPDAVVDAVPRVLR